VVDDGSPIAIVLLALIGVVFAAAVGGFTYNFSQGKRGLKAVPGYSFYMAKVKGERPTGYAPVK
jgi:hypothetical protein